MIINTPIETILLDIENELWVEVGETLVYIKKSPYGINVSLYKSGDECTELASFTYPLTNPALF